MDTIELRKRLKKLNKEVNDLMKTFTVETGERNLSTSINRWEGRDTASGEPEFAGIEINIVI